MKLKQSLEYKKYSFLNKLPFHAYVKSYKFISKRAFISRLLSFYSKENAKCLILTKVENDYLGKFNTFEVKFNLDMITKTATTQLEQYFQQFRKNIIGIDQEFESPYGQKQIVYTDWTASGRLYRPIEEKLMNEFGPFVANTHTETTISGTAMTKAYHRARHIIKEHVKASYDDVLIQQKRNQLYSFRTWSTIRTKHHG